MKELIPLFLSSMLTIITTLYESDIFIAFGRISLLITPVTMFVGLFLYSRELSYQNKFTFYDLFPKKSELSVLQVSKIKKRIKILSILVFLCYYISALFGLAAILYLLYYIVTTL